MGLRDKASKIDFASLVPTASSSSASAAEVKQPKTAPGAMMAFANDQRSELLRENEALRVRASEAAALDSKLQEAIQEIRHWDGATPTRRLDPREIGRSRFANRDRASFEGAEFEGLKREIQDAGGNVQAIKVRAVANPGEGAKYEIVYGHRRHEACLQLGLPVLAVVDNLDDRALFIEMDRENRERADLSPWEQGVMYVRALDSGLFPSSRQMASAIGVDLSNLGKAIALARLPATVIDAFASPLDLQFRWVPALNQALTSNASEVEQRARAIAADRGSRTAKQVFEALVSSPPPEGGTVPPPLGHQIQVGGRSVASVRFDSRGRASVRVDAPLSTAQQREMLAWLQQFLGG